MVKVKLQVAFNLSYRVREDKEAKVFVAYIPALRLFTQAKDESRVKDAVEDLVTNFVGICHQRRVLDKTMRESGLTKTSAKTLEGANLREIEYIMVGNAAEERYEVPITLLAGKQELAQCHHSH